MHRLQRFLGLYDRTAVLQSFDQEFGKIMGGWIRFDWQTDDAAVNYRTVYSECLPFGRLLPISQITSRSDVDVRADVHNIPDDFVIV